MHAENAEKKESTENTTTHEQGFQEFCLFMSMDKLTRQEEYGYKNEGDFLREYSLNKSTGTRWKKRKEYWENIMGHIREHSVDRLPNAWRGVYQRIIKAGDPSAMELWLAYFEGWDRKKVVEHREPEKLDHDDIRFMIGLLSKDKQQKFYDNIVDLITEAEQVAIKIDKQNGNE